MSIFQSFRFQFDDKRDQLTIPKENELFFIVEIELLLPSNEFQCSISRRCTNDRISLTEPSLSSMKAILRGSFSVSSVELRSIEDLSTLRDDYKRFPANSKRFEFLLILRDRLVDVFRNDRCDLFINKKK